MYFLVIRHKTNAWVTTDTSPKRVFANPDIKIVCQCYTQKEATKSAKLFSAETGTPFVKDKMDCVNGGVFVAV